MNDDEYDEYADDTYTVTVTFTVNVPLSGAYAEMAEVALRNLAKSFYANGQNVNAMATKDDTIGIRVEDRDYGASVTASFVS